MKKFVGEFKTFINRGNVVDLAVGVMIGSSFTAIVNGLSNFILKPLINFFVTKLLGGDSMSDMHTYLTVILDDEGQIDLSQSIYIDWGSFIATIINFIIIALFLFSLVKIINKFRSEQKALSERIADATLDRSERRELRKAGISIRDKQAVKAYFAEKQRLADIAAEQKKQEAEEKARLERIQNPTAEDILREILIELRKSK